MESIVGVKLDSLLVDDLVLVRHLVYFEGPYLSHYKSKRSGESYIYSWCEGGPDFNRWMIIRAKESDIYRFISNRIPMDQLIPGGSLDEFVQIVDFDRKLNPKSIFMVKVDFVPSLYCPGKGLFFDNEIEAISGSRVFIIEKSVAMDQIGSFFADYEKVYSFSCNVVSLGSGNLRKSDKIKSHPFREGFSTMHFWKEQRESVPFECRTSLKRMQYSSPGFIEIELKTEIAEIVERFIETYHENHKSINAAVSDISRYFRENKLNDEFVPEEVWELHNEDITQMTRQLLLQIGLDNTGHNNSEHFLALASRPFESAKMALAFVKVVRKIAELEAKRIISLSAG